MWWINSIYRNWQFSNGKRHKFKLSIQRLKINYDETTEDQFLNDSGTFTSVVKLNLEFVEFNLLQNWSLGCEVHI